MSKPTADFTSEWSGKKSLDWTTCSCIKVFQQYRGSGRLRRLESDSISQGGHSIMSTSSAMESQMHDWHNTISGCKQHSSYQIHASFASQPLIHAWAPFAPNLSIEHHPQQTFINLCDRRNTHAHHTKQCCRPSFYSHHPSLSFIILLFDCFILSRALLVSTAIGIILQSCIFCTNACGHS